MHEVRLDSVDSTQTYAKKLCRQFPQDQITCITAEEQTAGRGRYQRKWLSPRGNLYATFFFTLPIHTLHLSSLSQIMTLSFATILQEQGLHPQIKWPNDVQLSGKKVSGVLCETVFQRDTVDLFLGIGINVNWEQVKEVDQPATSLKLETDREWDKEALLKKLQKQFSEDLSVFKERGFAPFHDRFEKLLAHLGKKIRCFDGRKEWVGICHSLTAEGHLNLMLSDHTMITLLAGDIQ
jgi:BirA family biotin operon repressor/biotin-[acetyl-CoA-carboxylase] ligase